MAVLLIVAVGIIGFVTVKTVSDHLFGQVDYRIEEYVSHLAEPPQGNQTEDFGYSDFALLIYDESGELFLVHRAGYIGDPYSLPDVPTVPDDDGFFNVEGVDGDTTYRAVTTHDEFIVQGRPVDIVIATPIDDVEATIGTLNRTVIVTGAFVGALGIAVAWIITRRGMRPVDRMVADAETVASGRLDHRITPADQRTEMGRLSSALNWMVSRLTEAISERDRQHERLRQFVADAGHELRTPLTAIGGYVQLYQSGAAAEGEKLDRAMDRIGSENARLAKLVDDLMVLSRLDEEVGGDRELVELVQLAQDAVDDAEVADPDHSVALRADEPITVVANEGQLRQVLVNLLSNARVHTPAGTHVDVSVESDDAWAVLKVTDHGPGIPEDHRRRIFDRFYRADPSRSRATGGSGLGLSIVTSIVAGHGGELRLESTEGEGTTIEVRIPKAQLE
nr:HAMP domain-containing sensor histidine kinase [Glycomyces sp. L485]